jgi:hypothetical protein
MDPRGSPRNPRLPKILFRVLADLPAEPRSLKYLFRFLQQSRSHLRVPLSSRGSPRKLRILKRHVMSRHAAASRPSSSTDRHGMGFSEFRCLHLQEGLGLLCGMLEMYWEWHLQFAQYPHFLFQWLQGHCVW